MGGLEHELLALGEDVPDEVHLSALSVGCTTLREPAPPRNVLADRGPLGGPKAEVVRRIADQREQGLVPEQLGTEGIDHADGAGAHGCQ